MKFPKVSGHIKSVVKFEVKLLIAVAVLAAVVFFGTKLLIAKSAEAVANAYTQDFR